MIRINGKEFPSQWEELSPQQWLGVVDAMLEFGAGRCDFNAFQFRIVEAMVGKLPQDPGNAVLCENVFRLSEVFSWPYVYSYRDQRYEHLSDRMKELLRHHLPSQLDQSDPEVRVASSFEAQVRTASIRMRYCHRCCPCCTPCLEKKIPCARRATYPIRRKWR